jgi:hypothetical protein
MKNVYKILLSENLKRKKKPGERKNKLENDRTIDLQVLGTAMWTELHWLGIEYPGVTDKVMDKFRYYRKRVIYYLS